MKLSFLILFCFLASCTQSHAFLSKKDLGKPHVKKQRRIASTKVKTKKAVKGSFIDSKAANKIFRRQGKRKIKINEFKLAGHIGEAEDGFLKLRTSKGLSKRNQEKLNKIIAAENSDRKKLFLEAYKRQNLNKKQKEQLRFEFFKNYKNYDPQGVWYYLGGHWQKR